MPIRQEAASMVWVRLTTASLLLMSQVIGGAQAPATAPAQARQGDPPPIRESLRALGGLLAKVPNSSLDLNFAEWRVRVVLSKLETLSTNWPAQSPADYRLNLERSVATLSNALTLPPDQLTAVLEAIGDDLEVKLEHCTLSGGKLGGSVVVNVRTLVGGEESRNWQVLYLPRVLAASGVTAADRFPQLSSPTHETLVPGRYVMWARDPATDRVSERTVVKVGEGRGELTLDLALPAAAR
jgi:hypothetical protein